MRISPAWFLLLRIPLLHTSNMSGVKMVVRHMSGGISSDQTFYIENDRRRTEYRNWTGVHYGPPLASITRCDLGLTFDLNLDTGEYEAAPYPPKPLSKEQTEALGLKVPRSDASGKPTLRIEITTVDTGERKEFFGQTARHIITTRKQIPLAGSKSDAQQMVTDGWYIDLDTRISCDRHRPEGKRVHAHAFLTTGNTPVEKIEFVDNGEPETGFATEWKITSLEPITLPDGTKKEHTSISEMRVTQLVEGPLDPALFTTPTGFRQVEHIERNPAANLPSQWSVAWDRFKASVARLFH
jgi:hypothetical protein